MQVKKIHRVISRQFGLDLRRLWSGLFSIPRFISDYTKFRHAYKGKIELQPFLHNRTEEAGATNSEYFWQDLVVAKLIFDAEPTRHVDIGSRIDGFIGHVASYRSIEIFDIRPMTTLIPGVVFKRADLMDGSTLLGTENNDYCDSLSCLHALEHFGLGRYGDPINPLGYQLGLSNMAKMLKKSGLFYLSIPVGRERVEFNANWIFDPRVIIDVANEAQLKLLNFYLIYSDQPPKEVGADAHKTTFDQLAEEDYHLGLFIFSKEV